ncbi:jg2610 [Pararge aegeria aegeria]|uniref:Jg2610 protein n=2 Tax=Pararge aegeria TaxID=116150 RepID=A0A8S4QY39_9NEOP|nr:jg2610 [Pararge aegeria aegeria]
MAEGKNIMELQTIPEEDSNIPEEQNVLEEQNIAGGLTQEQNKSFSKPVPPDQSAMPVPGRSQVECNRPEQNWPMHERGVHGEINEICIPLDRNEVYFRLAQPYELQPLTKIIFRTWSDKDSFDMPAVEIITFRNSFPKGG